MVNMQVYEKQVADLDISVVIPTYNRAHLITRAVESVLNQTKPPAELIVVDDGSEDDTQGQLKPFVTQIRYIYQPNQGAPVARDNGVKVASSNWVAFLDSDDYWERPYLQQMAQVMVATSHRAHFYFGDVRVPPEYGANSFWAYRGFAIEGEYEMREDATEWVMMPGQPMHLIASIISREAYFACGGFWQPLRYRDDTHLFLKLGLGGPVCAVANIGAAFTQDEDPENRLTPTMAQRSVRGHIYQVMMLEELLARKLAPAVHQRLQWRLAKGHYSLARLYLRKGAWKTAVSHLWRSWQIDPKVSQQHIYRKLARSKAPTLQKEYS